MRNSVIWSFFSLVALAGGGLLSGCDSDDATVRSALGESCNKTSDCNDGLKCIQGTCYQSASSTGGSANNQGGESSGGTTVVGPPPPVLGTEGESCTKRADCEDGLGCYSGRCTSEATGEGGASPVGPRLGKPGETCVVGSDCEKGLSCVPGGYANGEVFVSGVGNIGVCSVTTTLKPSGKTCGAECREAQDCCELPQQLHVAYAVGTPWGTGAASCSELRALLGNAKCGTATGATGAQCAALATYCECEKDTWSCDAGVCTYQAGCTEGKVADQPEGCPTYSRSGRAQPVTTCNTKGACAAEPVEVDLCKRDADCEGMLVTNDPGATVAKECSEGECACHVESGLCYRKCDSDLDCDAGYNCDADTSLCTEAPACTTNEECIGYAPYLNAACDQGTCKLKCNSTLDCQVAQGVSDLAVDNYWVCGEDNFCTPLGCSTDAQCAQQGTGSSRIRMFCTEPAVSDVKGIQSAITD